MRISRDEMHRAAVSGLVEACRQIRIDATAADHGTVKLATPGGEFLASVSGRAVAPDSPPPQRHDDADMHVVVADVVVARVRAAYDQRGVGWLDRRGWLRLPFPIDADEAVGALPRRPHRPSVPSAAEALSGRVAVAVGLEALLAPCDPHGVRRVARGIGAAPSSVSAARKRLVEAGLMAVSGRSLTPELFWALADAWRPAWVWLAATPSQDDDGNPLIVCGDAAAAEHGAPIVVGADAPSAWYARDQVTHERVVVATGQADPPEAAARVAVAPSPQALTRADGGIAPAVVAALDLAGDPGRGQEVLQEWRPNGQEAVGA